MADIAIVEDDWHAIPHAWFRLGAPTAICIHSPDWNCLAIYRRTHKHVRPITLASPPHEPLLVQCFFRSRRLGELSWVSDQDIRDLECLVDECGVPRALLLVEHGRVVDGIEISRRRPDPLVRLLALEPQSVTLTT